MQTETVKLDERFGAEYQGKYVFCEISWAKRSRIIQKHTKYNSVSGQVEHSDFVAIQAETIWASLKEQPSGKPVTLEKLLGEEEGIPIALGELLSQIANRLCGMTPNEQRFLSEQSGEKSHTQPLQDSVCARNLDGPQTSSQNSQQEQSKNSS